MIVGQIQKGEKMGRTLNEDDVLKEIDRWIGYLDEDMITRIKIGIKKLQSAQPEQYEDAVSREAVYTVIEEVLYETTKGADNWYGLLNNGVRTLPSAQPEQRWIPCTDHTKLPKNKVLWITCEIYGCRVLKEIYWDMTEWSDDVSGLIAYMPYVEPKPYMEEGEK